MISSVGTLKSKCIQIFLSSFVYNFLSCTYISHAISQTKHPLNSLRVSFLYSQFIFTYVSAQIRFSFLHISFLFKCFCISKELMWSLRRLRMPCPDKTPNDKNILFANEDNKYQIISTGLLNLPNSRIFAASMRLCKDA